jgi:DsbC/DsbD-like thiol-disulfide interchange protein
MKKLVLLVIAFFTLINTQAQSNKQVSWSYNAKKIAEGVYEIHMTANINGNWHIYAQDGGDGPVSTSFNFTKNPLVILDGKVKEVGKIKKVKEEAFDGAEVRFYEKSVDFVQVVKVKGKIKTNLAGKVEFMVCNDKECLPPATVDIKVPVGG